MTLLSKATYTVFYGCELKITISTNTKPSMPVRAGAKRESKNAKQMQNTKQNCFSHSFASPRNDKQCSAKQCFANQTTRCPAGFVSRSDLFRDNARS